MGHRIERVEARARLEARREPYWQNLERGKQIGYRKLGKGGEGTWLARRFTGEGYESKPLGDFGALPERDRFGAAKRAAEEFFAHLDAGGTGKGSATVKETCAAYVSKLRLERSEGAADDAEARFRRLVDDDPIGRVSLAKLAPRHLAEWKKRVLANGGSRGGFNRNATALRAALNLAKRRREVATDLAWAEELKPFERADGRRTLYLDRDERRRLLDETSEEARPFFEALTLVPLRPGELAALKVEDLDARHRALRVPSGKTGRREIPLGAAAFEHLKACAKGKLPGAWLVSRSDKSQWRKEAWRDEIKLAAKGAHLPAATVAYTLRHSTITDLVTAGVDIFTVAKLAGTSVAMIEKHYGHLQREHARAALEKLAP